MRTIKFRGKKIENGEWLYGDLVQDDRDCYYIYPKDCGGLYANNKVDTETIGQFTVVTHGAMVGFRGYVEWRVDFAEWELKSKRSQMAISQHIVNGYGMKIVGNIHDNTKFLEEIK